MIKTRLNFTVLLFGLLLLACNNYEEPNVIEIQVPYVKSESTYSINLEEGITYAEGLSHATWTSSTTTVIPLKLDVYVPENLSTNRPALVLIHGGGLVSGSRSNSNMVNMANYFTSRGWVVLSLDYRLKKDQGTFPESWVEHFLNDPEVGTSVEHVYKIYPANRDVKAAIRWLYANSATYAINTDFISVGGSSAGAYLSVVLGLSEAEDYTNELSLSEDPTLSTTNLDQPSKVHTIIDLWGGANYINTLEEIYGHQRFSPNNAPILIAHGTDDTVVDFSRAEELRTMYETTGVDYEFHALQGHGHAAWNATVNGKSLNDLSFEFIISQQELIVE